MLIRVLSRTPGTTLHRELTGDDWTLDQHLLAISADALRLANWQRSKHGRFASRRPKPISPLAKGQETTIGDTEGRDPAEVMALLHRYKTGVFDAGG